MTDIFMRCEMKKKKKNRKLLFQFALVIIPLFVLAIGTITTVMYQNVTNSFLEAQNGFISTILNEAYDSVDPDANYYYFDYWKEHPDIPSSTKYIMLSEEDNDFLFNYGIPDGITESEWIQDQKESIQRYFATLRYSLLEYLSYGSRAGNKQQYNEMFIIDVSDSDAGFVYYDYRQSGYALKLGDKVDLDLSKQPNLKDAIERCSGEIVFDKVKDFPTEGMQYIGYKPIIVDGEVKAVIGVSYEWSSFQQMMSKTTRITFVVGIGGLLVLMLILLLFLYRRAIKPVGKIQKSVREYIKTKDSSKVTSAMTDVKTNNEIGLLSDNIAELAREIDEYTEENIKLAGEKERVETELDMAKTIQESQLPSTFPAFPDRTEFDIYASMTPAKEVGGDFYDFFFVDDDHIALVIADVSDKGVPAALFMMMSRILINNFATMGLEPHEIIERTNEKLCENNEQKMFVTVWLGILEISTGKITAVNAGHEYPVIRQPGGSFEVFRDKHCPIVGGMEDIPYKQYEITLHKGGTLFVYTDGVPEATNSDNKMFGLERLTQSLNEQADASPKELLTKVRSDVDKFVGDAPQFDDLTMLAIKLL